jgi:hypothetical protein
MNILQAIVLVSGMLAVAPVFAAPKLATFVEANGCKLRGDEGAVNRLKEFAAAGAVVWEGQCKGGFIEGAGMLREEGAFTVDGKTKKFAYFLSGSARKGLREGQWKRETFERFAGSPRFYTSASMLNYVDGVAKGKPRLLAITALDQLTPAFRQLVIDAQRDATPANQALLRPPAVAAPPVAVAPKPGPSAPAAVMVPPPTAELSPVAPSATAPPGAAAPESPLPKADVPPVATPPVAPPVVAAPAVSPAPKADAPTVAHVPAAAPAAAAPAVAAAPAIKPPMPAKPKPAGALPPPRITASSQDPHYGPEGLVAAVSPGWQSTRPPDYPEWIMVDFQVTREIRTLGMLAQDNSWHRAPRIIRIESSDDGNTWQPQTASQIPCQPNTAAGWLNMILRSPAKGRYLKIVILQNCGDPNYVAFRGLRFE